MKALILSKYGSPADLRIEEAERPVPEPDQVLIKVNAASVNDWDWALITGKPFYIRLFCGLLKPEIRVPGVDVAGEIIATGETVTRFQPGDQVFGDLSEHGFGAFAEYVCAPEQALTLIPQSMSYAQAAALPHAALLALQGLRDLGRLKHGHKVLINGGGGGVGTLGVQLAKASGAAEVTGVDRAEKFETMQQAGFDHMLDYRQRDFTKGDERYDLILDPKTNRSIFRYLRMLAPGGAYVTVGGSILRLIQALLLSRVIRWVTGKRVHILGLKTNQGLADVVACYEAGQLKPLIETPCSLNEAPRAIERFGRAEHMGKLIIALHDQAAEFPARQATG